jgi:hypothetical protein
MDSGLGGRNDKEGSFVITNFIFVILNLFQDLFQNWIPKQACLPARQVRNDKEVFMLAFSLRWTLVYACDILRKFATDKVISTSPCIPPPRADIHLCAEERMPI